MIYIAYFCITYQVQTTAACSTSMTQVPPLVQPNRKRCAAEKKKKKKAPFRRHLTKKRCCENRTVAVKSLAAGGVGVYIENNRGGCFDARRSAAVCTANEIMDQ